MLLIFHLMGTAAFQQGGRDAQRPRPAEYRLWCRKTGENDSRKLADSDSGFARRAEQSRYIQLVDTLLPC